MRIFAQAITVCRPHPTQLISIQLRNQVGHPPHSHFGIKRHPAILRYAFSMDRSVLSALGLSLQVIFRAVHAMVAHVQILLSNRDLFVLLRCAKGGFSQVATARLLGLRTCNKNYLSKEFSKLIYVEEPYVIGQFILVQHYLFADPTSELG